MIRDKRNAPLSFEQKFRILKTWVSDIIDMFGMNVRFSDETESHVTVTARVNEMSMKQFAKSYAPDVMVLEPEWLRDVIREEAEKSVESIFGNWVIRAATIKRRSTYD